MLGKKSVSTILFWILVICSSPVISNALKCLSEIIQNDNLPNLANISPSIRQFAFLIPLTIIFFAFQKKVIFTRRLITGIKIPIVSNFSAVGLSCFTLIYIFSMSYKQVFLLHIPDIVLIVFTVFVLAIFKQGYLVQNENNLTI